MMVRLNDEMKALFGKVKAFPVATASKDGWPNVVPIGFVELVDDETIWLADNFMKKTLQNVRENPRISIFIWTGESRSCIQIKGSVELKENGPEFEKMQYNVHAKMASAPAKTLLIMKIQEVFECSPGPTAGNKLL
jgi:uncharacterized protein